jgi:hypothetical protein
MRRIMLVVTVALVMAAMVLAMAMPAFADKGGSPHPGSCGVAKESAHSLIKQPRSPGASEALHPSEAACAGK